jgi:hypothetical protein
VRTRLRLYITLRRWLRRINPTRLGTLFLLIASLVLIATEYLSLRASLLSDIVAQASIIGENSTAALAFRDRDTASEILAALKVSDHIERAVIVDRHYSIQAAYDRNGQTPAKAGNGPGAVFEMREFFPEGISGEREERFTAGHLYLARPIADRNRLLGYIFIQARLRPLYERLVAFLGAALIALPVFGALGVALVVVDRLRGQVSRAQQKLYRLAYVDPVTQLPNRNVFNQRLQQSLARLHRQPGRLGLLFLDLDNFKFINDTFGHPAGDRLLHEVTRRLSGQLRESDLLCRLGGDEFAVILEDIGGQ